MALSHGMRSSSVSGTPRDIFSMLAGGWKVSASANSQLSCAASMVPMVVLPAPVVPMIMTTTVPFRGTWPFRGAGPSDLSQKLAEQRVEMVHAIFTLDGVAPAVIRGRTQPALNIFAKADVFLLHLIAEGDGTLHAFLSFF